MKVTERIAKGPWPIIGDGAMGTRLLSDRTGLASGRGQLPSLEYLNVTAPDLVTAVHRSYLAAGAEMLITNTFCATTGHLQAHGLVDKTESMNFAAVELARRAICEMDRPIWVLGSCGPLASPDRGREQYAVQMGRLAAGGVDAFLIESVRQLAHLEAALEAAAAFPHVPVLVSYCPVDHSLDPADGPLSRLLALSNTAQVVLLGVNCGDGGQLLFRALAAIRERYAGPLLAIPSAGLPDVHDGRTRYPLGPDRWTDMLAAWHETFDLAIVGGCCGTTPEHIRALVQRFGMTRSGQSHRVRP